MSRRLVFSDQLAITFDWDAAPVVYVFANPDHHVRIPEAAHALLLYFSGRYPVTVAEAVTGFIRNWNVGGTSPTQSSVLSAVRQLIGLGVLASDHGVASAYSAEMAPFYARARQIPAEIARTMADSASVGRGTAILDVATGTGSLALELARYSDNVTGLDICGPFLDTARAIAEERGTKVRFLRACANKLALYDGKFDVIALSQAFHWLDMSSSVRGIYCVLKSEGSLYVLESKPMLSNTHPLRTILGHGCPDKGFVERECTRHVRWYATLLEALKPSGTPLRLGRTWVFHQRRPFDLDYARAFFLTRDLKRIMPEENDPWLRLATVFSGAQSLDGDMYWLLMEFRRITCPGQLESTVAQTEYTCNLTDEVELPYVPS